MSKEFTQVCNALSVMEQALTDARHVAMKNSGLRDQADKVRGLERDNESMVHSINLMNEQAQEREHEITRLNKQIEDLQGSVRSLRDQLIDNEPLIETLRNGHAELRREVINLAGERSALRDENKSLRMNNTIVTDDEIETLVALRTNKAVVLTLPDNLTDIINEIDKMVEHAKAVSEVPLGGAVRTDRKPPRPAADMDTETGSRWDGSEPSKRVRIKRDPTTGSMI